jgi:hypothetical protein
LVASFKNLRGSKLAVFSIKCLRTAPVDAIKGGIFWIY